MNPVHEVDEAPFMCIVCHEEYPPPWYQCGNGHITCMRCHRGLPEGKPCPLCRVAMPIPIRNLALEKFVQQHTPDILVKCPQDGCPLRLPLSGLDAHTAHCPYIPVPCVYGKDVCSWNGPRPSMYLHIMEKHGAEICPPLDEDFHIQWSGVADQGIRACLIPANDADSGDHILVTSSPYPGPAPMSGRILHVFLIEGKNPTDVFKKVPLKIVTWNETACLEVKMKGIIQKSLSMNLFMLGIKQHDGKPMPMNITISRHNPGKPPRKKQKVGTE